MAAPKRTLTVEECLQYLDDTFDIPGDGLDSECEDLSDDESDLQEPEVSDSMMPETEEAVNRISNMDFIFDDDLSCESGVSSSNRIGRPTRISLDDEQWEQKRIDVKIPNFSQTEGATKVLPKESGELEFFLLFIENKILSTIVKETNIYAEQCLKTKKRDISTWQKINVIELKAFLGLLIAMSLHRIPWLRDYGSENWVLGVPAFAAIMPRKSFFEILG